MTDRQEDADVDMSDRNYEQCQDTVDRMDTQTEELVRPHFNTY